MKYTVISSVVITSCAILASATPTFRSENAMIKRRLANQGIDAREFYEFLARSNTDDELELFGRAAKGAAQGAARLAGEAASMFIEGQFTNPQGAMGRDDRQKNREQAIDLVTGRNPRRGPSNSPLHNTVKAISAANAFEAAGKKQREKDAAGRAAAHQASQKNRIPKRDFFDGDELDLFVRGSKVSKLIEKQVLNPKKAMAKDKKDDLKDTAKDAITGENTLRGGSTSPIQKVATAISAAEAFRKAGEKKRQEEAAARAGAHQASQEAKKAEAAAREGESKKSKSKKRSFFDDDLEFETRDFEDELFTREYELDELE